MRYELNNRIENIKRKLAMLSKKIPNTSFLRDSSIDIRDEFSQVDCSNPSL